MYTNVRQETERKTPGIIYTYHSFIDFKIIIFSWNKIYMFRETRTNYGSTQSAPTIGLETSHLKARIDIIIIFFIG